MDYLTREEVSGLKQDIEYGKASQEAEKDAFERKLLSGLGDDMEDLLEHPDRQGQVRFARKQERRKRWAIWKENFKKIFGKV